MNRRSDRPFIVRYQAFGFPDGMIKRIDDLYFSESELVHALFTTGRAPGDQLSYGDASVWELLHRAALVRAYIRQDVDQRLVLSRLALELDRSEKSALSYAIGQAMTGVFSRRQLDVQFLMHIDRYASRWSVRFANKKRPDLFGCGRLGWMVAEAKGRQNAPDASLREKIRAQKESVISIQGAPPALAIGCVASFPDRAPWMRLDVFDPEPQGVESVAIAVDIDRYFLTYYEPFIAAVDAGGLEEADEESIAEASVVSARFDPFGLRIGLLEAIDILVRRAKEQGNLTGLSQSIMEVLRAPASQAVFSDGTLVEAQWGNSIFTTDWLY